MTKNVTECVNELLHNGTRENVFIDILDFKYKEGEEYLRDFWMGALKSNLKSINIETKYKVLCKTDTNTIKIECTGNELVEKCLDFIISKNADAVRFDITRNKFVKKNRFKMSMILVKNVKEQ
jgi:hypothetical protein